ncbi:MAG: 3-keto-disaccharide hydrolase, partial [Planctomycetota bacterium]
MARKLVLMLFAGVLFTGCQLAPERKACCETGQWYSLFDGKSLNGWRAGENKGTFTVREGMIVVDGPRSHLFYVGPIENANFKNFEIKAEVMTKPSANSGIYFHTKYQETGWPDKGYEVQVNNTHSDWR